MCSCIGRDNFEKEWYKTVVGITVIRKRLICIS